MRNVPQHDFLDPTVLEQKLNKINTIEFLPDRDKMESYNKTFYKNLEEIKIINLPIDQEKKLFYNFETNSNASMTSTIHQIGVKIFLDF